MPQRVRNLIETRLQRIGEEAEGALSLAAVAGMEPTFSRLWAALPYVGSALQLTEGRLLDGLDRALGARILEERGGGYAFRHPLLRAALYERQSSRRRAMLHGALAAGIAHTEAHAVDALAYHYSRSATLSTEYWWKAIDYLERAGDRARSIYAAAATEAHYRSALGLLTESGDMSDRLRIAQLEEKLGGALISLARYDEALAILEQARAVYVADDELDGVGRLTAHIGRTMWLKGAPSEGIKRVEGFLVQVQGSKFKVQGVGNSPIPPKATPYTPDPAGVRPDNLASGIGLAPLDDHATVSTDVLAANYVALSNLYLGSGAYEQCFSAADHAISLLRRSRGTEPAGGDGQATLALALCRKGAALAHMGQRNDAESILKEAIVVAERIGDLDVLARSLNNLASNVEFGGDSETALHYRLRAVEASERLGDPALLAFHVSNTGGTLQHLGRWTEARAMYERAVALFDTIGPSWVTGMPYGGLGWICLLQGDVEEARRHAERAVRIADRSRGGGEPLVLAISVLAVVQLREGRALEAMQSLLRLLEREEVLYLLPVLAEVKLSLGDMEDAIAIARRAAERARRAPSHRPRDGAGGRVTGLGSARTCRRSRACRRRGSGGHGGPDPRGRARSSAGYAERDSPDEWRFARQQRGSRSGAGNLPSARRPSRRRAHRGSVGNTVVTRDGV